MGTMGTMGLGMRDTRMISIIDMSKTFKAGEMVIGDVGIME